MSFNSTMLVVSAHPDDEALGCAGTIVKHVENGGNVFVLFMTNGVSARSGDGSVSNIVKRKAMAENAKEIMGITENYYLDFPDNAMDTVPFIEIVKAIEEKIRIVDPEVIYTHFSGDLNIDHRLTYQAVMTACRPQPNFAVREILCFEVNSSTEWSLSSTESFRPNVFVDISSVIDKKKGALKAYGKEMRTFPHTRSFEAVSALASFRGGSVGVLAAEGFILERSMR